MPVEGGRCNAQRLITFVKNTVQSNCNFLVVARLEGAARLLFVRSRVRAFVASDHGRHVSRRVGLMYGSPTKLIYGKKSKELNTLMLVCLCGNRQLYSFWRELPRSEHRPSQRLVEHTIQAVHPSCSSPISQPPDP